MMFTDSRQQGLIPAGLLAAQVITDLEPERAYAFGSDGVICSATEAEAVTFQKREGYVYRTNVCAGVGARCVVQAQTIVRTTADDFLRFVGLMNNWKRERGVTSSVTAMVMCPSYLGIVGMGEKALPFIFRQLELEGANPDHWFIALEAITKANPVTPDMYGDMPAMSKAWLDWADQHYAR